MEGSNNQNTQSEAPKRRPVPKFAMAFFFLLGFYLIRKGSTESTQGTLMLVLGWILWTASVALAVVFFVRTFKHVLKKK